MRLICDDIIQDPEHSPDFQNKHGRDQLDQLVLVSSAHQLISDLFLEFEAGFILKRKIDRPFGPLLNIV